MGPMLMSSDRKWSEMSASQVVTGDTVCIAHYEQEGVVMSCRADLYNGDCCIVILVGRGSDVDEYWLGSDQMLWVMS